MAASARARWRGAVTKVVSVNRIVGLGPIAEHSLARTWHELTHGAHEDAIVAASVAAVGPHCFVFTASRDSTARQWSLETCMCVHVFEGHTGELTCLDVLPDAGAHRACLATGGSDCCARLWHHDGAGWASVGIEMSGHAGAVRSIALRRDAVYTASDDGAVMRWSHDGVLSARFCAAANSPVRGFVVAPNGAVIAGYGSALVSVFRDPGGSAAPQYLRQHTGALTVILLSPSGDAVVTACVRQKLVVWDLIPSRPVTGHECDDVKDTVLAASFVQGDAWTAAGPGATSASFVAGYASGAVRLWSTGGTSCVATYTGNTDRVSCISAVNGVFVCGTYSCRIFVWLAGHAAAPARVLVGHTAGITALLLLVADDSTLSMIASASEDSSLRLWPMIGVLHDGSARAVPPVSGASIALSTARSTWPNVVDGAVKLFVLCIQLYIYPLGLPIAWPDLMATFLDRARAGFEVLMYLAPLSDPLELVTAPLLHAFELTRSVDGLEVVTLWVTVLASLCFVVLLVRNYRRAWFWQLGRAAKVRTGWRRVLCVWRLNAVWYFCWAMSTVLMLPLSDILLSGVVRPPGDVHSEHAGESTWWSHGLSSVGSNSSTLAQWSQYEPVQVSACAVSLVLYWVMAIRLAALGGDIKNMDVNSLLYGRRDFEFRATEPNHMFSRRCAVFDRAMTVLSTVYSIVGGGVIFGAASVPLGLLGCAVLSCCMYALVLIRPPFHKQVWNRFMAAAMASLFLANAMVYRIAVCVGHSDTASGVYCDVFGAHSAAVVFIVGGIPFGVLGAAVYSTVWDSHRSSHSLNYVAIGVFAFVSVVVGVWIDRLLHAMGSMVLLVALLCAVWRHRVATFVAREAASLFAPWFTESLLQEDVWRQEWQVRGIVRILSYSLWCFVVERCGAYRKPRGPRNFARRLHWQQALARTEMSSP